MMLLLRRVSAGKGMRILGHWSLYKIDILPMSFYRYFWNDDVWIVYKPSLKYVPGMYLMETLAFVLWLGAFKIKYL